MTAPSTPRQTQSYLQQLFAESGIAPRSRLGQNFLIDLNLQHLLVESARLRTTDIVLEVGAGTGGLTAELAASEAHVVAVEIDPRFHELVRRAVANYANVTLIQGDVLESKNRINPDVLGQLERLLAEPAGEPSVQADRPQRRLKLVANLPYSVATPVISNLLATDLPLASMTVTIQQELAGRLTARPRTKDYGALSVWVQAQARVRVIRRLPPSAFWPRPKVFSAIVQIHPQAAWRKRIADRALFHEFVRRMFLHRRKTLANTLAAEYRKRFSKAEAAAFLESQCVTQTTRPEQLTVPQWIALANALHARWHTA